MRFVKYGQLIFLILLLPTLLYGLSEKECQAIKSQALAEWDRHTQLALDYQNFGADQEGHGLHRLKESLYCCQRALSLLDGILENIASKPSKKRKKPWRIQMKMEVTSETDFQFGNNDVYILFSFWMFFFWLPVTPLCQTGS